MRSVLLLLASLGLLFPASGAQDTAGAGLVRIHAVQAKQHLSQDAVVTGKVVEVNKAERLIRLNFDKPFPNQPFTVVIFARQTNLFPQIEMLKDKTVEVSGKITEYRNRPQIILASTNQLRIVEKTTPGAERK